MSMCRILSHSRSRQLGRDQGSTQVRNLVTWLLWAQTFKGENSKLNKEIARLLGATSWHICLLRSKIDREPKVLVTGFKSCDSAWKCSRLKFLRCNLGRKKEVHLESHWINWILKLTWDDTGWHGMTSDNMGWHGMTCKFVLSQMSDLVSQRHMF